jgi:hypothetical protein
MPIREATPEETQAFYAKTVVVFGQKRPESQKAPQPSASVSEDVRLNMLKTLGLISAKLNHQVALNGEQEPKTDPNGSA